MRAANAFDLRGEFVPHDEFVTANKNIRYQQNLTGRKIAIVTLGNAQWPVSRRYVQRVVAAVEAAGPGSFAEVEIPFR
jgi:hypothetical protein